MTERTISGTTLPTTPPTIAPMLFFAFESLGVLSVWVGDEAGRVLGLVLLLAFSVLIPLGVASGSRPTDIATASLYVSFGRLVTLMNAHRGTSVPGGTL